MGVGVADDDVEDGGIDQLQHLKRRTCCRLAQQREAVPKHRPAFSRIFAVRWNTKRLRKILLMQPPDFAIRCHTIVAGHKQIGPPVDLPPFRIDGIKTNGAREGEARSEEHTSELQSLMRISYAVFCLKKNKNKHK